MIVRLNGLLENPSDQIKEDAAENLASISFDEDGKAKTVASGSIKLLAPLLSSEVSAVRCSAARCLASLG